MNILYEFRHGLADHLQFQIVLKHIKHYHPEIEPAVECMPGCDSIYTGICPAYQQIHPFFWRNEYPNKKLITFARNQEIWKGRPSTKVTKCLIDEFDLEPIPELYRYEIHPTEKAIGKAKRYQEQDLNGKPYAIIHYNGTASPELKDLTNNDAAAIIEALQKKGLTPVILDWDDNPLADNKEVFSPSKRHPYLWDQNRYGDAGTIAALIDRAEIFFGIDSGPAHIAGATETPSVVFWTGFHPITNFDPAPNVLHVVSDDWEGSDAGAKEAVAYWEETTNHEYYRDYVGINFEEVATRVLEQIPDAENVSDNPK